VNHSAPIQNGFSTELAAEAITLRIRWFGLAVGYALVNFIGRETNQPVLNAILTLGAGYALIDSYWSFRNKVFLSQWPLVISLMEAIFIGLLCHFDAGLESPFRFYYFLSLLVCAIRNTPWITYSSFALLSISFATLSLNSLEFGSAELTTLLLMILWMGWVTWASTALSDIIKKTSQTFSELNEKLQQNQSLLEQRISERTIELQESQALIVHQEKQAAFGLLAAGIAHEVGNPLAAISSLVQMLNRRDSDEYTKERLQLVDDQLRRIQRTLRELIDFSRPASSAESFCDIHEVLEAALNIAKYYKRKKGKTIVTGYATGLPNIRIVRDQLVQVFLNLILNAMDATDEGGTIEICTSLKNGWIEVAIRDDGSGISTSDLDQVFKPYFTTKKTGTGLGLFVCQRIVEQNTSGKIELTETSKRGTTFTVRLTCENVRQQPDVDAGTSLTTKTETIQEISQP